MNPRHFRLVAGLALSVAWWDWSGAAESAVAFQAVEFSAASGLAAKEGKVIVIDFYTTWCEPCQRLDRETWTDAAVGKLLGEKAIALKLDAEKEGKALAARYKIEAYPTVLVLKADGTVMDRLVGFRAPETFVRDFNSTLEGKTVLSRAYEAVAAARTPVAAQPGAKVTEGSEAELPTGKKPASAANTSGTTTPTTPKPVAAPGSAAGRTGPDEEVDARYQLGKELARADRYEEALAEFVWLFRTGMKGIPRYGGVRVSFLTSEMGRLAKKYPPAVEVLRNLRDDAGARLLSDASDSTAASDFAALNDALEENEVTLNLLQQLPANDPRRAVLGQRILRPLIEDKQYALALQVRSYAQAVAQLERMLSLAARMSAAAAESLKASMARDAAITAEALGGSGDVEHARQLVKKILEASSAAAVKEEVKKRMTRAGHPELAP